MIDGSSWAPVRCLILTGAFAGACLFGAGAFAAPGDPQPAPPPALRPGVNGTVIKPPDKIDSGIKAPMPAPERFRMPVIKPQAVPAPDPVTRPH